MRAIVTNPGKDPRLEIREVPDPAPTANQVLVRIEAFSLNQGETRTALDSDQSYVPGWDFAGVVEQAAAVPGSPDVGTKVFGFAHQGSWAQFVAVHPDQVARIPAELAVVSAAALPVAGVTAMLSLEKAGSLLGRNVLITGAAGGVGRFACRLAALAGANVHAVSRRAALGDQLRADGVEAAVFSTVGEAAALMAYDLIFDSVGGDTLSVALKALARHGLCVNCGNSSRQSTSFDAIELYRSGGGRLQSVWLGTEKPEDIKSALIRLAALAAKGDLSIPVDAVLPWDRIDEGVSRLIDGKVSGKIVLEVA